MTKILAVTAGVLAVGAVAAGTDLALGVTAPPSPSSAASPAAMAAMSSAAGAPGTTHLVIQHVLRGCHVWTDGSHRASSMSVKLDRGSRLEILDQDIDPHQLVELAGPKVAFHGHMMMGQKQLITFTKPGTYLFKTKVVEMGPMMDVKTIGPDNTLRLRVSVSQ